MFETGGLTIDAGNRNKLSVMSAKDIASKKYVVKLSAEERIQIKP